MRIRIKDLKLHDVFEMFGISYQVITINSDRLIYRQMNGHARFDVGRNSMQFVTLTSPPV